MTFNFLQKPDKWSQPNLRLSWRWWLCRLQDEMPTVYQLLHLRLLRLLPEDEHNMTSFLYHLHVNLWFATLLCDETIHTIGCIWSSSTSTSSSSSSSSSTAASWSSAISSAESESAETWPVWVGGHKGTYEWWLKRGWLTKWWNCNNRLNSSAFWSLLHYNTNGSRAAMSNWLLINQLMINNGFGLKNVKKKKKLTSSNVSFCPKWKDIQVTVIWQERSQKIRLSNMDFFNWYR